MATDDSLSEPITLRIPVEVLHKIDRVAAICAQSREWVFTRALRGYLTLEGADVLAIEEGRRQIEAGDWAYLDETLDELEREDRDAAA